MYRPVNKSNSIELESHEAGLKYVVENITNINILISVNFRDELIQAIHENTQEDDEEEDDDDEDGLSAAQILSRKHFGVAKMGSTIVNQTSVITLQEGQKVLARYLRQEEWFSGVIQKVYTIFNLQLYHEVQLTKLSRFNAEAFTQFSMMMEKSKPKYQLNLSESPTKIRAVLLQEIMDQHQVQTPNLFLTIAHPRIMIMIFSQSHIP